MWGGLPLTTCRLGALLTAGRGAISGCTAFASQAHLTPNLCFGVLHLGVAHSGGRRLGSSAPFALHLCHYGVLTSCQMAPQQTLRCRVGSRSASVGSQQDACRGMPPAPLHAARGFIFLTAVRSDAALCSRASQVQGGLPITSSTPGALHRPRGLSGASGASS